MKNELIFKLVKKAYHDDKKSSLFNYASFVEEALKYLLIKETIDKPLVIVKENTYNANNLYESMLSFLDDEDIALYTPEESMRSETIVASYENRSERINALYKILEGHPKIIITTVYGLVRHLPLKDNFKKMIIKLKLGDIIKINDLEDLLNNAGYQKDLRSEVPLSYAKRGSIIDVFSVNYNRPIRIEFFDDEIDSIRFYDVNTQRTIEKLDEVVIAPASDIYLDEAEVDILYEELKNYPSCELDLDYLRRHRYEGNLYYYLAFIKKHHHLLDYINDKLVMISNDNLNNQHFKTLMDETFEYIREYSSENDLPLRFNVFSDIKSELAKAKVNYMDPYGSVFPTFKEVSLANLSLDKQVDSINLYANKYKLICLSTTYKELVSVLDQKHYNYHIFDGELKEGLNIYQCDLYEGFEISNEDVIIFTQKELFNNNKKRGRYERKYEEAHKLNDYSELEIGDYVVHSQYGIGQYMGIKNREINGIRQDYLKIAYRGNDELLVPLVQFGLVRKYVSKDGVVPKLHKLGSKEWAKTKAKVQDSVDDLAKRLVKLYSERENINGFAYSKDNEIIKQFEDEFSYDLTNDQKRSIDEIKHDMESEKPMDRLLCGDVGFGKTEVAIRASMKAVLDNKQVVYLCPTTILSMQHYKTFKQRFKNYPVNIVLLNRYVSYAEVNAILRDLKEGKIDILIGTHKVLGKDVKFKDLGLLIIDEEQRFGVAQKEKIKEYKNNIDVLSLSATPIPRTLQMSLVGLRGLSTIDTAPNNRYPVQTYVTERSMGLMKEVIERELSRKGQVFILHNNTKEVYTLANKIKSLIKEVRVAVAHGKMTQEEIEDVMLEFYEGKADVLICTTIIETGIDIPNANTIVIDNAQNFGLSQLYQIRGRVGRSDKVAYAYLMVPKRKELTEVSTKRLNAIKEFTSLGSGYKIAMRDLSIRGAGDMLGAKQSGFIDNVGLDLYLSMLEDAIKKEKGEEVKEVVTKNPIPLTSYIPDNFSENEYDKLNLYHRLEEIDNRYDLFEYFVELTDRFGKLPKPIEAIFEKKKLELLLDLSYIESMVVKNHIITITVCQETSNKIDGMKLFEKATTLSKDIKIAYTKQRMVFSIKDNANKKALFELLENLNEVLKSEN